MIELGLSRVFRLLARTPLAWPAIHVAGTNGKGSICAYISAMFSAYNQSSLRRSIKKPPLKYGRFTSPHLIDRWDCITINEETVSEFIFKEVEARVKRRDQEEDINASEFELLTATAFEIFTQEKIDVGVIEVGLGGRLDATNILGQRSEYDDSGRFSGEDEADFRRLPLLTVISSIGLDHQAFLGDTIEAIATEKAGILKSGVECFLAPNPPSVKEAVQAVSRKVQDKNHGMPITIREISSEPRDLKAWLCSRVSKDELKEPRFEALAGRYMPDDIPSRRINALTALEATHSTLLALGCINPDRSGEYVDLYGEDYIKLYESLWEVPFKVVWPGRLQQISLAPLTGSEDSAILDGAHNAQSAAELARYARKMAGGRPITWLLAVSASKDIQGMLALLLKPGDRVVTTRFGPVDGMPWVKAMDEEEIQRAIELEHRGCGKLDPISTRHPSCG